MSSGPYAVNTARRRGGAERKARQASALKAKKGFGWPWPRGAAVAGFPVTTRKSPDRPVRGSAALRAQLDGVALLIHAMQRGFIFTSKLAAVHSRCATPQCYASAKPVRQRPSSSAPLPRGGAGYFQCIFSIRSRHFSKSPGQVVFRFVVAAAMSVE